MRNISININLQFYRSIHCLVFVCLFVVFILINIFTFERLFLSTITFLKISEEIDYDQLMILTLVGLPQLFKVYRYKPKFTFYSLCSMFSINFMMDQIPGYNLSNEKR